MERIYVYSNISKRFEDQTSSLLERPRLMPDDTYKLVYRANPGRQYSYGSDMVALVREKEAPIEDRFCYWVGNDRYLNPRRIARQVSTSNPDYSLQTLVIDERGKRHTYQKDATVARESLVRGSSLFRYLLDVSIATRPTDGDEPARNHLFNQLKSLANDSVRSLASSFLVKPSPPRAPRADAGPVILPFGSSLSQMDAIDAALDNRISVIQGPPGTGKTQTILNIIANLIVRDKTVLVVSPNDSATNNVVEKLRHEGMGFLVAEMGRRDQQMDFVRKQDRLKPYPVSILRWKRTRSEQKQLADEVNAGSKLLREVYGRQRKVASLRERLRDLELEYSHFGEGSTVDTLTCKGQLSPSRLRELHDEVVACANAGRRIPLLSRIRYALMWGIGRWRDYGSAGVDLEIKVDSTLYQHDLSLMRDAVESDEGFLATHNAGLAIQAVTARSRELFQAALYDRFGRGMGRTRRHFEDPMKEPEEFRGEYPVISSTTHDARKQLGKGGLPFDYVIIDEASQVDLLTGFLALSSARRAVVVGDRNQLPCVLSAEHAKSAQTCSLGDLPNSYEYSTHSLLDCLGEISRSDKGHRIPCTLLREHYRCAPDIIGFCNRQFYGGQLMVMSETGTQKDDAPALGCSLGTERGEGPGDYGKAQARILKEDVLPQLLARFSASDIGVATPYRKEADGIRECLSDLPDTASTQLEVGAVREYQGREKAAMALVTTASQPTDLLNNPNLVNVAVSRAQSCLWLIATRGATNGEGSIADLRRYIEYHSGPIEQSRVRPVFPYLYSDSSGERDAFLQQMQENTSDQYFEVQVEVLLKKTIESTGMLGHIGWCRNYPLKLLVPKDGGMVGSGWLAEEERFVSTSAHVDFMLFRHIDNSPLAAFELDEAQNDRGRQAQRDRMKDGIFDKIGLPFRRIRANEGQDVIVATLRDGLRQALGPDGFSSRKATSIVIDTDGSWTL